MPRACLTDRAVIEVAGAEARDFLDRLVTSTVPTSAAAGYAALLTPQGKIIADFVVHAPAGELDRFLLDVPAAAAGDLTKRLALYRLRAKVVVADRSGTHDVVAGWDEPPPSDAVAAADPRLAALGWRAVAPKGSLATSADEGAFHARRIAAGVPEGGRDFAFNDAFPHEALMDQLGGVDFGKGCYIGQEVVSRMQHRGTARTRIVPLAYDGEAAAPGAEIVAGERTLGRTGSAAGSRGLGTIRLDRAADALAAGDAITAGGRPVALVKPTWVRFAFPGEAVAVPA